MKRILLLGANGQVGQALTAEPLPADMEIIACGRAECDITNHAATQKTIQDLKPDLVINAAAMTNVDQCERERAQAVAANFEAPANLAAQCSARDIPLVHLSTDYVFNGQDGETPYVEDAQMCPLNVYADTKMCGEIAVQEGLAWHVVLRVSSVFSAFGQNILTKNLSMLAKNDEVKIVSDQTSCPTYAPDLAKTLIAMTSSILRGQHGVYGLFHYCGEGPATRIQFVETVMASYAQHTSKRPRILPALSSDFPGYAERPPYSVLDCSKIKRIYGIGQRSWREGVIEAVSTLHQQGKLPA